MSKNSLTIIPSKDILNSWDRKKFPSFTKYLESNKYQKFVEDYYGKENSNKPEKAEQEEN